MAISAYGARASSRKIRMENRGGHQTSDGTRWSRPHRQDSTAARATTERAMATVAGTKWGTKKYLDTGLLKKLSNGVAATG